MGKTYTKSIEGLHAIFVHGASRSLTSSLDNVSCANTGLPFAMLGEDLIMHRSYAHTLVAKRRQH